MEMPDEAAAPAAVPCSVGARVEEARAAGLPRIKVRDGDGKRVILVSREFIALLTAKPPRFIPCPFSNEHLLRIVRGDEAKLNILVKAYEAGEKAAREEMDILEQYRTMGHAYTALHEDAPVHVDDDDQL